MRARMLVAVICIPLLLVIIYVLPPIALSVAVAFLAAMAAYELLMGTGFVKNRRMVSYAVVMSAAIPFWAFFGYPFAPALLALLLFFVLLCAEFMAAPRDVTFESVCGAFLSGTLIPFMLSALVCIRQIPLYGIYLIALPIAVAFISDAFGLFAGMLLGKHKLAPRLSPKKTVEGAVGALLGGALTGGVYAAVLVFAFQMKVNIPLFCLFGLLGSVISQFGDLSFSCIKREYGIKDYGKLLPGHGGVLDRFDSVIFCAPLFLTLFLFLPMGV